MQAFGFKDLAIELSTRPEKYIGSEEDWIKATAALEEALKEKGLKYDVNVAEGAFYGPKIDIKLKDALKRQWQCATIQCDFALPKRFDLSYIDDAGKKRQPVMLHRVLLGSLERFMGALIEHYNADFPLWLAPVQALVIPIKDSSIEYGRRIKKALDDSGLRAEIDIRNETLDKKIRGSELGKIPYSLVIGDKEEQSNSVAVRRKGKGNIGSMSLDEFVKKAKKEIEDKAA